MRLMGGSRGGWPADKKDNEGGARWSVRNCHAWRVECDRDVDR